MLAISEVGNLSKMFGRSVARHFLQMDVRPGSRYLSVGAETCAAWHVIGADEPSLFVTSTDVSEFTIT